MSLPEHLRKKAEKEFCDDPKTCGKTQLPGSFCYSCFVFRSGVTERDKDYKEVIEALELAKAKLEVYRKHSSGEYHGGMEHMCLMTKINGAFRKLKER